MSATASLRLARLSLAGVLFAAMASAFAPSASAVQNQGYGGGGLNESTSKCTCFDGSGTCTLSTRPGAQYCTKDPGNTCSGTCDFLTTTTGAAPTPATRKANP